ncbi:MAG: HDOD domain-containing protein [Desulfobacteraceae bacterium]|jgi:HD-like signal output (HDOD) protein|nr:HDOD domain-containing protein [Desulfobacteraceae bacterium]
MFAISTDKLKPGKILAEEVRDINGRLLLARGNEIEINHIRIFKIWGVSEVNIEGPARGSDKFDLEFNAETLEQVRETVTHLFRHTDLEHPVVKKIFNLSVQYRCENNLIEPEIQVDIEERTIEPGDRHKNFIEEMLDKKKIVLPEIPSVVFELNEVIANPISSADHIARVVNKSPSLTALLLRIVNSSFYGLPSKIDKVSHAVTLIGTREISGLALGISILSIFKNIPKEMIDMYSFLKHSLACGILSRILAAQKNFGQTEQLFVSGLLHDLGRLILYIYFAEESRNILSRARNNNKLLYEAEDDYLGCNHAQVGKQLMEQWKLPLILENNVLYHHNPSEAQQPIPAAIVHLADIIVNSLGIGSSGEKFVPPLDTAAWENLDLPLSSFETVIGQATHQFYSLESILQL